MLFSAAGCGMMVVQAEIGENNYYFPTNHIFLVNARHFASAQHQIFKDLMGNTCFSTIRFSALFQIGPGPSVIISLNKESGGEICFVST